MSDQKLNGTPVIPVVKTAPELMAEAFQRYLDKFNEQLKAGAQINGAQVQLDCIRLGAQLDVLIGHLVQHHGFNADAWQAEMASRYDAMAQSMEAQRVQAPRIVMPGSH